MSSKLPWFRRNPNSKKTYTVEQEKIAKHRQRIAEKIKEANKPTKSKTIIKLQTKKLASNNSETDSDNISQSDEESAPPTMRFRVQEDVLNLDNMQSTNPQNRISKNTKGKPKVAVRKTSSAQKLEEEAQEQAYKSYEKPQILNLSQQKGNYTPVQSSPMGYNDNSTRGSFTQSLNYNNSQQYGSWQQGPNQGQQQQYQSQFQQGRMPNNLLHPQNMHNRHASQGQRHSFAQMATNSILDNSHYSPNNSSFGSQNMSFNQAVNAQLTPQHHRSQSNFYNQGFSTRRNSRFGTPMGQSPMHQRRPSFDQAQGMQPSPQNSQQAYIDHLITKQNNMLGNLLNQKDQMSIKMHQKSSPIVLKNRVNEQTRRLSLEKQKLEEEIQQLNQLSRSPLFSQYGGSHNGSGSLYNSSGGKHGSRKYSRESSCSSEEEERINMADLPQMLIMKMLSESSNKKKKKKKKKHHH